MPLEKAGAVAGGNLRWHEDIEFLRLMKRIRATLPSESSREMRPKNRSSKPLYHEQVTNPASAGYGAASCFDDCLVRKPLKGTTSTR